MSAELYLYIRFFLALILLVIGVGLAFGVIPQKLQNSLFDKSRRVMGIAIIILPITVLTSYSSSYIYIEQDWGVLINLVSLFIITLLVSVSFVPLLGDHIPFKSTRFIRIIAMIVIYPIPLTIATLIGEPALINVVTTATSLILLATIIYECVSFYLLYRNAVKRVNNFYSDDIEVNISWLRNSALFMLSIGLVSGIIVLIDNIPIWCYFILSLYRSFVFIFVFCSFVRFIISFANLGSRTPHINPMIEFERELMMAHNENTYNTNIVLELQNNIKQRLEKWIEEKNYTQKNITLHSLSHDIEIDRLYISNYINSTYELTFKAWITGLRIERAKELFIDNPEQTISDVADSIGFLSIYSFARAFKQKEGVAPNRWRQRLLQKMSNQHLTHSN